MGTLVHGWCETLGWWEDGLPPDGGLLTVSRDLDIETSPQDVDRALDRFHRNLAAPQIQAALSRSRYASPELTVERELPFAIRTEEGILQGYVDRLVLEWEGDQVVRAHVLDFKTDAIETGDEEALADRTAHYAPQLNAYRRAMAQTFGLSVGDVAATLLFLTPGRAVDVAEAPR